MRARMRETRALARAAPACVRFSGCEKLTAPSRSSMRACSPQDACATLNLPYAESVCEAGGREVICVTVQQGHLVCRGLILPVDEPGTHRVVFERLRGDPLAYHKLFKQIAQHMHEC